MRAVSIRRGTAADLPFLRDMLYEAAAVGFTLSGAPPPSLAELLAHPSNARYLWAWGRAGDIAVVAVTDGAHAGAAWCRLFAPEERGDGIVAEPGVPEVAIGVRADMRGWGLGRALLDALADAARDACYARLALSVDPRNPACRLYERAGYRLLPEGHPHAGTSLLMERVL